MEACERCKLSGAKRHSLNVEMSGNNMMLAQFTLCDSCYEYGEFIEPIARVNAFLSPSHMIITDIENKPVWYYVMNCHTFEYITEPNGDAWHTDNLMEAQDKLAGVS